MGFKCPNRKNVADFLQEVLNHQMHIWRIAKYNSNAN
jgi:hypothetical protein